MKKILALCDQEVLYVKQMMEFLQGREELPFTVYAYTEPETLVEFAKSKEIDMLVVSESSYTSEVEELSVRQTILLNESGKVKWENIRNVDKYQQAKKVYQDIMDCYLEQDQTVETSLLADVETKLIGFYSPVGRCLQTSFALTLGQMLARQYRTLYISFEQYAGWNGLLSREEGADLSDLLCFAEEGGERFRYRLRLTEQKLGGLFYIPPAFEGQNLVYVTAAHWAMLLDRIAAEGGYDFVLMDLGEGIQGVYELLRRCNRIFTIEKEDGMAAGKILQYEQLLQMQNFEDVLEKTSRQKFPLFCRMPVQIEQFTKGDLAEYVRRIMREELGLEGL